MSSFISGMDFLKFSPGKRAIVLEWAAENSNCLFFKSLCVYQYLCSCKSEWPDSNAFGPKCPSSVCNMYIYFHRHSSAATYSSESVVNSGCASVCRMYVCKAERTFGRFALILFSIVIAETILY